MGDRLTSFRSIKTGLRAITRQYVTLTGADVVVISLHVKLGINKSRIYFVLKSKKDVSGIAGFEFFPFIS